MTDKKQLNDALEEVNTRTGDVQQAISDLPAKIAYSVKSSKNEGNESK